MLIFLLACCPSDPRPDTGALGLDTAADTGTTDSAPAYVTDADTPRADGLWLVLPPRLRVYPGDVLSVPMRGRAEVLSVACWGIDARLSLPAVVEGDTTGELTIGDYTPTGAALPGCLVASTAGDKLIGLEWR